MFDEQHPAAGLRATQKEATRQAVLEAARAEFERMGFEAANVRAIAALARVSPGTVLHHYGDKRELLHAALFDDLEETLASALQRPMAGSLLEQLTALTREVFGYYQRRPKLSRTLLKESLFSEPPWAARFTAQVGRVHEAIAGWAAVAAQEGELCGDVQVPLLGAAYFSFFYFALIAWVQGTHPEPVELVRHLLSQHLQGLRPTPRKGR